MASLVRRERTTEGPLGRKTHPPAAAAVADSSDSVHKNETWPGGVPKRYRIERGYKIWVLVVKRWGLQEQFITAIERANPGIIDLRLVKAGTEIAIPDPSEFIRSALQPVATTPASTDVRVYEIKRGDMLEIIAYRHLGSKTRWPDIVSLNPGIEPDRLYEGQEICLPRR